MAELPIAGAPTIPVAPPTPAPPAAPAAPGVPAPAAPNPNANPTTTTPATGTPAAVVPPTPAATPTAGAPAENAGEEKLSIQTFATHRQRGGISVKNYNAALMDPWPLLREVTNTVVYPNPPPIVGQKLAKVIAVKKDLTLPNMNYFGNSEVMKSYGDRKWIAAVCRVEELHGSVQEPSTNLTSTDSKLTMGSLDATFARMHKAVFYAPQDDLFNSAGVSSLEAGDWVYVEHEDKVLNANGWIKGVAMKKDVSTFAALASALGGALGGLGGLFGGSGVGSSGAILGNSAPVQLPPGQYPLVMRYAAEKGIASDWPTNLGDGHIWAFGIRDQDNANIDKFVDIGGACWKEGGSFKYFEWAISTKNGLKYGFLAGLGGTLRPTPLLQDKKPLEAMYYATGRHKRNEPVANAYKAFNPDNPRESAWTFGEKTYRTFPWDIVNNDPNKFYARGAYSRGMNMHRTTGDGREAPRVSNWSEGCQVWNSSTGLGHMLEIAAKGADGGKFRYVILNKWWTGAKPDLSGVGPPTQVQPPTAPASSEPPVGNGVLDPTRAGPGWDEASEGSGVLL